MSLLGRIFGGAPKQKANFTEYEQWFWDVLTGGASSASGQRVNPTTALHNPTFFAGVQAISQDIAKLPLVVMKVNGDTRERWRKNPLWPILHDAPWEGLTSYRFRVAMQAQVLTRGNAYAEIFRDNRGRVLGLKPFRSGVVQIARAEADGTLFYRITDGSRVETLSADRMLHLRGLTLDGDCGLSAVSTLRDSIGIALAAQDYAARFYANDATPRTVFTRQHHFQTDEAREKFRDGLVKMLSGENRHKPLLLEDGFDAKPMGMSHEDSQFIETRRFQRSDQNAMNRIPPHKTGDLDKATFCLPAGTLVSTVDGPRPIEKIDTKDAVWSKDQHGDWVKVRVLRSECTGADEILKIRTTNRTLRANARHRVLVRRKYSAPKDGYRGIEWRTEYAPAGDLCVGDTIVCLDRLPAAGSRHCLTRTNVSVGFMEFCGLLLGDGNVYPKWGVSIARGANALYMDAYRATMRSEFVSFNGGNGRGDQTVVERIPVVLREGDRQTRFSSVLAARELMALGFTGTAHTKTVPSWVFGMTEELRLAFLRGFLDADGSVDKLGRVSFSSCNDALLSGIRHLCMGCGVPVTNMRVQRGETTLPNGERAAFEQWGFTCSDPGANRRIGSHDPRYVERLEAGRPFGRKGRNYPRFGGDGFDLDGCSLSRIVAIDVEPEEPVYDLEVDYTHNFIADGVLVHNSNIEQSAIEYVVDTLMPHARNWESELTLALVPEGERESTEIQLVMDALLRGDSQAQAKFFAVALGHGGGAAFMTPNEIRKLKDLNPHPDGDYLPMPAKNGEGNDDDAEPQSDDDGAGNDADDEGEPRDEPRSLRGNGTKRLTLRAVPDPRPAVGQG